GDAHRALCLGAALWRFWQMRGHLREGRARLDAILAMSATHDHPLDRARALEAAGGVAYWQGEMDACQAYYDECLALTRANGDAREIANALYNDSFPGSVTKRDIPKGRTLLEEALPIFRQLGDEHGIANCLWALGQVYYSSGDFAAAVSPTEEAITVYERLGDRFGTGWALFVRSTIALKMNESAVARPRSLQALKIFAAADDVTGIVLVLDQLSEVARRDGDRLRAARLAGASAAHEVSSGAGLGTVVGVREGWRTDEALSEAEVAARAEGHAMTVEQAVAYAFANDDKETESAAAGS
ncbi:MAG TPA: tetratricopeptide repeat protein, partial [Methylomirabilota bacterium]|nr:tetratricopeptide repeat protein [Methylomirabilota bacterium]